MAGSIQDIHSRKQRKNVYAIATNSFGTPKSSKPLVHWPGASRTNSIISFRLFRDIPSTQWWASSQQINDTKILIKFLLPASVPLHSLSSCSDSAVDKHLQLEPVNANSLMKDLVKLLQPLIGENISIELDLNPGANTIHADAGHIQQLIMNLCINARDAMPSGGVLRIETQPLELTDADVRVVIQTSPSGTMSQFRLAILGCGIPDELREHIFEPFFTTKGVGKGTGLGFGDGLWHCATTSWTDSTG